MLNISLYTLCIAAMAVAATAWCISHPRLFHLRALQRALVGASLTPFLIGAFMLAASVVAPGAPARLFTYGSLVVAAGCAVLQLDTLRWAITRSGRAIATRVRRATSAPLISILRLTAIAVWLAVIGIAIAGTRVPIIAHDALIYLNEALAFAQSRSIAGIPNFDGAPWDVIAGHPHSFLFQAYLAHALLFGDPDVPGYPNDIPARLAFQITFICLIAAISAACALFRRPGVIALGLLATLAVGRLEYISESSSRDGFRLIPVVVLLTLLCVPLIRRFPRNRSWGITCGIVAALAVAGHTLNVFALFGVAIAAGLAYWRHRVPLKDSLLVATIVSAFVAVAGLPYALNYAATGHPLGYGMYYLIFKGTPLADIFLQSGRWSGGISVIGGFRQVFSDFGFGISLVALVLAALGLARPAITGRLYAAFVCFAAYFLVTLVLPLSGALDIGTVNLRGALISNFRYPLMSYILVGVVCAPIAIGLLEKQKNTLKNFGRITVIALALLALSTAKKWDVRKLPQEYWTNLFPKVEARKEEGERWITTDNRIAYYHAHFRPIFIYTKAARPLLLASSPQEIWSILKAWNVRSLVLDRHIQGWWNETALYQTLSNSPTVRSKETPLFHIFQIDAFPADP